MIINISRFYYIVNTRQSLILVNLNIINIIIGISYIFYKVIKALLSQIILYNYSFFINLF